VDLQVTGIRLRHPDNWKPYIDGNHVMLAPDGGIVGQGNVVYGIIIDVFQTQGARNLNQANAQFLENLRKNNPAMKTARGPVQVRVDGQPAILTELSNESPGGGEETDQVITVLRSSSELLYFVLVSASKDLSQYQPAFRTVMDSVRLR
jgi:hypothetical protein